MIGINHFYCFLKDVSVMSESTICNFGNIQERDMDMMFLECLLTDDGFVRLFLRKAEITGTSVEVLNVALSETDPEYGESDITVLLSVDGKKHALLIEDKINAPAMPEQCDRYSKRASKAKSNGKYNDYSVFIICPSEYYNANSEAKKYAHFITYEECVGYFSKKTDTLSKIKCEQLKQALTKDPGGTPEPNPAAIAFFEKYRAYMEANRYKLDLRNKKESNGWWPHYGTTFGNAYIYHKVSDGVVDLTFPKGAANLATMEHVAQWLQTHGMPNVNALATGKAAALRIKVPVLDQHKPFEDASQEDVKACFDAVQQLSDLALMFSRAASFVKTK